MGKADFLKLADKSNGHTFHVLKWSNDRKKNKFKEYKKLKLVTSKFVDRYMINYKTTDLGKAWLANNLKYECKLKK